MEILILAVFIIGYIALALEHKIHIDKAAIALITGVLCWTIFVLGIHSIPEHLTGLFKEFSGKFTGGEELLNVMFFEHRLLEHLSEISSILFFLLGAMTIVELIDAHEGFNVITDKIKTTNKVKLLWIVSILTFFLSAGLDNLTTCIVMVSLLRKLIADTKTRWFFLGIVIIAANAGGAWSPIGDVTTTMLWIGGQITVMKTIASLLLPSFVCLIVPLTILSFIMKGEVERPSQIQNEKDHPDPTTPRERRVILALGIGGLLFVPIFKSITHLPPFMGMLLSLGILWFVTERMHKSKNQEEKDNLSVTSVLRKIDTSAVLFFLGILLAVSVIQEIGYLRAMAEFLKTQLGNVYAINIIIGLLSSIVDNVPLVAGSMGMYDITAISETSSVWDSHFVKDGPFWQFLAYCAGTGGSALIIGSAAGVAVMGMEKIDFIWYLKKISIWAILGYLSGAGTYYLMFGL